MATKTKPKNNVKFIKEKKQAAKPKKEKLDLHIKIDPALSAILTQLSDRLNKIESELALLKKDSHVQVTEDQLHHIWRNLPPNPGSAPRRLC
jgi:hypothetical protein